MYLIKNAEIYAPEYMGKQDVLLGGEKILKIGKQLPVERAYGIEVIDGTGMLLTPGLIDSHVHILGGGGEGGPRTRTPEIFLSEIVQGGVTTVVGCLGTDGCTRTMSNLLAKAKGLEAEGVTAYVYTGSYQVPVRTLTGKIMDDIILLDSVIGTGEIAVSDHRSSQPSKEEFEKLVAETRVGGILSGRAGIVNIHMGGGKRKLELLYHILEKTEIPAINMLPTHMNRSREVLEDGMNYAKKYGGYIDLTTSCNQKNAKSSEIKASKGLKLALESGVSETQITFSSDAQGSLPVFGVDGEMTGLDVGRITSLFQEVRDAVKVEGLTLAQALMTVTSNPASVLKLSQKGKIAEGMDGDVLLLEKESLKINSVFARGKLMMYKNELLERGTFE